MTVPEENRPRTRTRTRTRTTDELLEPREQNTPRPSGGTGRTLREALEEAQVRPDDFEEE